MRVPKNHFVKSIYYLITCKVFFPLRCTNSLVFINIQFISRMFQNLNFKISIGRNVILGFEGKNIIKGTFFIINYFPIAP